MRARPLSLVLQVVGCALFAVGVFGGPLDASSTVVMLGFVSGAALWIGGWLLLRRDDRRSG
ncbi:MAG: hypothetical protein ACXW08_13815 [Solirubrobacteraceae bacterium]